MNGNFLQPLIIHLLSFFTSIVSLKCSQYLPNRHLNTLWVWENQAWFSVGWALPTLSMLTNGVKRIRTADPLNAIEVLYQLSYNPVPRYL